MIHIGIDLHSRMRLVAINDNGKLVAEEKRATSPANLALFFQQFDEPVHAVVECTSYWYWVADWCSGHGVPLTLAHAKMLKAITYAKVKTDSVDARTLAELLRVGLIPEVHQCRRDQRDLGELTRGRLRLVQCAGSCNPPCGGWPPSTMCRSAEPSGVILTGWKTGYSRSCHWLRIYKPSSCLNRLASYRPISTGLREKLKSRYLSRKLPSGCRPCPGW